MEILEMKNRRIRAGGHERAKVYYDFPQPVWCETCSNDPVFESLDNTHFELANWTHIDTVGNATHP
jgi:hypothetical protein